MNAVIDNLYEMFQACSGITQLLLVLVICFM